MKKIIIVLLTWAAATSSFSEDLRGMFSRYESIDTRRPNIQKIKTDYGGTPTFRSNIIHKDDSVCYEDAGKDIFVVVSSGSIEGGVYLTKNKKDNWICTKTNKEISANFGDIFIGQNQDDFYLVMNSIGIKSDSFSKIDNNGMSYQSHEKLKLDKEIAINSGQEFYVSHVTVRVSFTNKFLSEFSFVYMESL